MRHSDINYILIAQKAPHNLKSRDLWTMQCEWSSIHCRVTVDLTEATGRVGTRMRSGAKKRVANNDLMEAG